MVHDSSLALLEAATNPDPNPEKGDSGIPVTEGSALLANAGPDGTLADGPKSSTPDAFITTYTVVDGDTLSSIAAKNGISINTVRWANNLTAKSLLKPGMKLEILPITGIQYTVRKGDTVASLAKKYSGNAQDILTYNGIDEGQGLIVGDSILIPDGEPAVSAPTKTTTSRSSTSSKNAGTATLSTSLGNPLPAGRCTQGIHDNNGIDIGAPSGTPIYAALGGSVIIANDTDTWGHGWGYYVVINHPNGEQTLYAHMSKVGAEVGEEVNKGTIIGYVGETGKATGNHLHFEVHKGVNPFCR